MCSSDLERDARGGEGAHEGNRSAQGPRGAQARRIAAVPGGERFDLQHGRLHRPRAWLYDLPWNFLELRLGNGIPTFRRRREPHLYVTQWYILGAIFWFPWLHLVAQFTIFWAPATGVVQPIVNWWFGHNTLGLWFTPIGLAFRVMGRDRLERRLDRQAQTYWKDRDTNGPPPDYFSLS